MPGSDPDSRGGSNTSPPWPRSTRIDDPIAGCTALANKMEYRERRIGGASLASAMLRASSQR